MFANRGSGGASGSGGGAFGSRSGGVGVPAGCFGSKNPAGFDRLATRSRPRIASPASCRPAFRPTRGSFVDCAAAPAARPPATAAAARNRLVMESSEDHVRLKPDTTLITAKAGHYVGHV